MRAWIRRTAALGAAAVIAAFGGAHADSLFKDAASGVWAMLSDAAKAKIEGIAIRALIDEGLRVLDPTYLANTSTLQSADCAAFRDLSNASDIDKKAAALQASADTAEAAMTQAAAVLRSREFDVERTLETLNTSSIPLSNPAHEDQYQNWQEARAAYAAAQTEYVDSQRLFFSARASARLWAACAAAAKAVLAQPSAAPASGAAPAPPPPPTPSSPPPAPPPPGPAAQGSFQGAVMLTAPNLGRWVGRYTAQPDPQGGYDGKLTWTAAPPKAGLGFSVGDQLTWFFNIQPNGDIDDPNTVFGRMTGHVDPATQNGSGVFLGPCTAIGSVPCSGAWTATP